MWSQTTTYDLDLWHCSGDAGGKLQYCVYCAALYLPNIYLTGHPFQQLMSWHTGTHTRPISLSGPLMGSVITGSSSDHHAQQRLKSKLLWFFFSLTITQKAVIIIAITITNHSEYVSSWNQCNMTDQRRIRCDQKQSIAWRNDIPSNGSSMGTYQWCSHPQNASKAVLVVTSELNLQHGIS